METPHTNIIEETECSMLYDEESILLSDSRLNHSNSEKNNQNNYEFK